MKHSRKAIEAQPNIIAAIHHLHSCKVLKDFYLEKAILLSCLKNERVDLSGLITYHISCYDSCVRRDHFLSRAGMHLNVSIMQLLSANGYRPVRTSESEWASIKISMEEEPTYSTLPVTVRSLSMDICFSSCTATYQTREVCLQTTPATSARRDKLVEVL